MASGQEDILDELELEPETYHFWAPLRLAEAMEQAAQRIRERTQESPH